jgi:hypothetical membrane protein
MKRLQTRPLLRTSGFAVIICYLNFTLLSWLLYPSEYNPMTHYLSRLGDYIANPYGAIFYNLGCIFTGLALIPFFFGFRIWYKPQKRVNYVFAIGEILGIISGVALVMIGVFSEDQGQPHLIASSVFFLVNFFTLFILSIAFLLHDRSFKLIPVYGILFDVSTLILSFQIGGPIIEWFTVFGSLFFVFLVILDTHRLVKFFSKTTRFNNEQSKNSTANIAV